VPRHLGKINRIAIGDVLLLRVAVDGVRHQEVDIEEVGAVLVAADVLQIEDVLRDRCAIGDAGLLELGSVSPVDRRVTSLLVVRRLRVVRASRWKAASAASSRSNSSAVPARLNSTLSRIAVIAVDGLR
jgi:hypothetical protein